MDLKALKTFHKIVEHESFIRAAEEMNYAQSTVTTQMQRLEAELGVRLIERGRAFMLTEAGRLFYGESLALYRGMERLQQDLLELREGGAGHVRLGTVEPTGSLRLPGLLEAYRRRHPGVRLSVAFGNTPLLARSVAEGELELAICTAPDLGTGLYFEPLFRERFHLLVPADHPLSGRGSVRLAELSEHRLLITAEGCPYRRKLELLLREAGGASPETMEIGSMTALHRYVAAGLGIALVPESAALPVPAGTVPLSVEDADVDMPIGLLHRAQGAGLSAAAARLRRFLAGELADPGGEPAGEAAAAALNLRQG